MGCGELSNDFSPPFTNGNFIFCLTAKLMMKNIFLTSVQSNLYLPFDCMVYSTKMPVHSYLTQPMPTACRKHAQYTVWHR